MITLNIKQTYKYKFIVTRNRRQISEFNTKKQAKQALQQTAQSYNRLNSEQDIFNFTYTTLMGGENLVVYTINRLNNDEFRDQFEIRRILNE